MHLFSASLFYLHIPAQHLNSHRDPSFRQYQQKVVWQLMKMSGAIYKILHFLHFIAAALSFTNLVLLYF